MHEADFRGRAWDGERGGGRGTGDREQGTGVGMCMHAGASVGEPCLVCIDADCSETFLISKKCVFFIMRGDVLKESKKTKRKIESPTSWQDKKSVIVFHGCFSLLSSSVLGLQDVKDSEALPARVDRAVGLQISFVCVFFSNY